MSSDDSDNEEKKAALADALQCSFVKQAFDGKFTAEANRTILPVLKEDDKTRSNFQETIAEILSKRLDEKIKEAKVTDKEGNVKHEKKKEKSGIQLFSTGRIITSDDLLAEDKKDSKMFSNNSNRTNNTLLKKELYEERAAETAVSADWVCSKLNTNYWVNIYKPRLIKMKKLKSVNDEGAIVCQVLDDNC